MWTIAFTVHSSAFMRLGPYFERLMCGFMLDATERRVVWDDISPEIFWHFCQFTYCGDYEGPDPDPEGKPKEDDGRDESLSVTSMKGMMRGKYTKSLGNIDDSSFTLCLGHKQAAMDMTEIPFLYQMLYKFVNMDIYTPHKHLSPLQPWPLASHMNHPEPLSYMSTSFQEHLELHTDMYMLGDRYGVTGLQETALYKCWQTLLNWPLVKGIDMLPTVADAFSCITPGDSLRELLTHFIASLLAPRHSIDTDPKRDVHLMFIEVQQFLDDHPELSVEIVRVAIAILQ